MARRGHKASKFQLLEKDDLRTLDAFRNCKIKAELLDPETFGTFTE